jgi:uncharacterized membrane protein YeiH
MNHVSSAVETVAIQTHCKDESVVERQKEALRGNGSIYAERAMISINLHTMLAFTIVEFSGVAAGALAGALEARRSRNYQYDLIGVLGLALITALGGGITRDILLQKGPPLAFMDVRYLLVALGAGCFALLFGRWEKRFITQGIWFADAASLGLFSVAGVSRALNAGLPILPSLLLGLITAAGGGALRDVLMGRTPRIFERGEPYTLAALLAAVVFLGGEQLGLDRSISTASGALAGLILKLLSARYQWKTPTVNTSAMKQ